jgi:probable HAF family extracellular repeat protein
MTNSAEMCKVSFGKSVNRSWRPMLVVLFFMTSGLLIVQPTSALYDVEDVGCSGYLRTYATGINDADQIVGYRHLDSGSDNEAVVYDSVTRTWTVLPDFGADVGLWGMANAVNSDGEIVGICAPSIGLYRGTYWPASHDRMIVLDPLPGGTQSDARGVNDLHEAVGYSVVGPNVAVMWTLDSNATSIAPVALGSAGGMQVTMAQDINNNHAVVGYAYNDSAHCQAFYCAGYGSDMQLLPHLSAGVDGPDSRAYAISDSGLIVGYSTDSSGVRHAVVWQPPYNTTIISLDTSVVYPSTAFDVSTDQTIVGYSVLSDGMYGFSFDMNSGICEYLRGPVGMNSCRAVGVNDIGHITGWGAYAGSEVHSVLWTPNAPPVAAFTATVSGLTATVDASASYDAEGEIAYYLWEFGDGAWAEGKIANHTYAETGQYTITLRVNDSAGQMDSLSLVVSMSDTPEAESAELILLIEECTSFSQEVEDRLIAKVTHALDLIEARKSHGASSILLAFDNLVSNYVLVGKIADEYEAWDLIAQANFVISLLTENHMIAGVPLYTWYHGCGPTATGMLIGYWDSMGFGDLIKGEQGNEVYQSPEVNAMMASQGHIDDYVYPLDGWIDGVWVDIQEDNSTPGCVAHPDDSVADFMHTSRSVDGLVYGQSYADMVDDALVGYTDWASGGRYVGTASIFHQGSMSWGDLQGQVDAAHPMVFVVDWDGDGESDHLVTVVGYCEIGRAQMFAFYSTWDNNVWWALFDIMKEGNFYGVFAATTFSVANAA